MNIAHWISGFLCAEKYPPPSAPSPLLSLSLSLWGHPPNEEKFQCNRLPRGEKLRTTNLFSSSSSSFAFLLFSDIQATDYSGPAVGHAHPVMSSSDLGVIHFAFCVSPHIGQSIEWIFRRENSPFFKRRSVRNAKNLFE